MGTRPQLIVVSGLSVRIPLTVRFRPQLIVVLGLSVGIPLTVRFRPQLLVVLGLSVGIPLTLGFLAFTEPSAITKPLHKLSFLIMKFQLSRSLFTSFSFTGWNFGYHGAFHELFFHTMEFRLSWSLSWTFLSHDRISAITEPFTNFCFTRWNFTRRMTWERLFSYISQRVFK
jgi:hypothetical protein